MTTKRRPLPVDDQNEIVTRVAIFELPQLDDEHLALIAAAAITLMDDDVPEAV